MKKQINSDFIRFKGKMELELFCPNCGKRIVLPLGDISINFTCCETCETKIVAVINVTAEKEK